MAFSPLPRWRSASSLLLSGSRIALDVPTAVQAVQGALAAGAGEAMHSVYGPALLEGMAKRCGLRLREGCECQILHSFFRKICKRSPTYASYE